MPDNNPNVYSVEVSELDSCHIFPDPQRRDALLIARNFVATSRMEFAMNIMERWAAIAAEVDGEDSVGRQKVRHTTPREIVDYSVEVTELAFERFAEKGWMQPMAPTTG